MTTTDSENNNKWKERIEALMRKAEDPATPQAERDTLVDKIAYFMAKYGIEEAMLSAQQKREEKLTTNNYKLAGFTRPLASLLNQIALAFGCKMILRTEQERATVYGYEGDQERCLMLYGSLYIQLMNGLASSMQDRPKGVHIKPYQLSFVSGFVVEVSQRIARAYTNARNDVKSTEAGSGMDIVLLDRDTAVRNLFRSENPFIRNVSGGLRHTHEGAYMAGKSAGSRADIGTTRIGQSARNAIGSGS